MYFYKGYDYEEKVDLSEGDWNPKRKMWGAMHFSEIIELKFGKKLPYILCILTHFYNYCFSHIVLNRAKILLYWWANSLRNPNIPRFAERMRSNKRRHRPLVDNNKQSPFLSKSSRAARAHVDTRLSNRASRFA